ncbi:MAG: D-aminopeptidase [Phycisphaerae bacterium]|nr:D-aminopeptidase [Phycisphaerae bacterium]
MRIYMMSDMEGISGIVDAAYTDCESDYHRSARALMTTDVNAAVAGCFDGGAREVVVRDGHHHGNNFETAMLDRRIVLDKSRGKWTAALDGSFDATMIVGQHAMAGTINAFLDHTMSAEHWHSYSINGVPLGELGMWATMAGHFNVPLVYLSGDQAACDEAAALLPGIATTAIKQGVGRNRATGPMPERAHEMIRADVARALRNRKGWPKPLKWKRPLVCQLTFNRSDFCDGYAGKPGIKRIDARTIEQRVGSQLDILY